MIRRNAIHLVAASSDLIETAEGLIQTAFACTNLFFSVKYKPLPTGSSGIENEQWLGF